MFTAFLAATCLLAQEPLPWPQWGGPTRDFQVTGGPALAETWPEGGPPELWSRPLGEGYAAVVCDGPSLYTMLRRDGEEVVVALDRASGETRWERGWTAPIEEDMDVEHGPGPHSTPTLAAERLVAVGVTVKVNCLARETGAVLWSRDLRAEYGATHLKRGYCASPLVHDGAVILPIGGEDGALIALSLADGTDLWRSQSFGWSYSSPLLIEVGGQAEVVVFHNTGVDGVDPVDGTLLWSVPHENARLVNITTPVYGADGVLVVSSAYGLGSRGIALERVDGKTEATELWSESKVQIHHGTAVRVGDHVYGSSGHGPAPFAAIDARTGEVAWRERGLGKANVLAVGDELLALDDEGTLSLLDASPSGLTILTSTRLREGRCWTVPTLIDGLLYVRDREGIAAYDLRAVKPPDGPAQDD